MRNTEINEIYLGNWGKLEVGNVLVNDLRLRILWLSCEGFRGNCVNQGWAKIARNCLKARENYLTISEVNNI